MYWKCSSKYIQIKNITEAIIEPMLSKDTFWSSVRKSALIDVLISVLLLLGADTGSDIRSIESRKPLMDIFIQLINGSIISP